ncbi:MAG: hypothetical protein JST90_14235 [Bacteroidetes bacterium]|nr:hypothetical protein [Bacteroidota bacterium]
MPQRTDEKIEAIRLEIEEATRRQFMFYKNYIEVEPTKEFMYRMGPDLPEVFTLKRSYLFYYIVGPLVAAIVILSLFETDILIVSIIFSIWLIVKWVLDVRIPKEITLKREGICLDRSCYSWQKIFKTYIASEPHGKSSRNFLWIVLFDGERKKYNISNRRYDKLGHQIEQYRRLFVLPDSDAGSGY